MGSDTVTFQFEIDRDEWDSWKTTVDRETSLDERLRELVALDRAGSVFEASPDITGETTLNSQGKLSLKPSNGGRTIRYAVEFLDDE